MTTEQEFTDTLVQEYSRAGWQVEDLAIAAEELNFRPDIVLKRGDEILVIEVKRAGFVDKRAISRIKRKVEEKPNWHFELKLIPPSREFKAERPVRDDVKRRITLAERLLAEGFASEAFILTWTALEAILRDLVEPNGDESRETGPQLLRRAYEAGSITDVELRSIERSYQIRSRLTHGFAVEDVDRDIHELLPIAKTLAKRAEETTEK